MATELTCHSDEDPSRREDDDRHPDPQTPSAPLLYPSLAASSDIVQALFGESAGSSWGDFFCTHNRIRGRLFATSQAVLFYSNLLGFERRLSLRYQDVMKMELYRSTSIRISTVDCETYIFKSFHQRKHVLQLLRGLKLLVDRQQNRWSSQVAGASTGASTGGLSTATAAAGRPDKITSSDIRSASNLAAASPLDSSPSPLTLSPTTPSPMPNNSNRRRAVSDSFVGIIQGGSRASLEHHPTDTAESVNREDSFIEESDFSLKDAWNEARKPKNPPLQEVGIDSLSLACSLDVFFQQCLADNAPYSLDRYQRDYIKDQDVKITTWHVDQDGNYSRTLTFTHPIKNTLGLGPSAARTTRHQRLCRFRGHGMILENTTVVGGIPYADAFHVQDCWVIAALDDYKIQIRVCYDTRFTKLALFKAIIEKSVRRETKEWCIGYTTMLQEALMDKSTELSLAETEESTRDDTLFAVQAVGKTLTRYAIVIVALLSLLLLVALLQLLSIREAVSLLRNQANPATFSDQETALTVDELPL